MGDHTTIEWTDATVNFWWGCTKVGPGCDHCYAERTGRRKQVTWGTGQPRHKIKGAVALMLRLDNAYSAWAADHECRTNNAKVFGHPVPGTQSRRRVFVQSMSDLFDLEVPAEWFSEAWDTIERCDRLTIQIVTKRLPAVEKRLAEVGCRAWPAHAGLIATVCSQDEANRDVPRLLDLKHRFSIPWVGLSIEPMLGPVSLTDIGRGAEVIKPLAGLTWCPTPPGFATQGMAAHHSARLDWVICGGESGPQARPMHPDWARSLRDQCVAAGVAFFMKKMGGSRKPHPPIPDDLFIREAPNA